MRVANCVSLLSVAVTSLVLSACRDSSVASPLQPEIGTPNRYIQPATSYSASDDETAVELDAATGRLKVTDLSTNTAIYADLNASEVADMGNILTAMGVGDANSNALEYLNPTQNMPPGWEPQRQAPTTYPSSGRSVWVGSNEALTVGRSKSKSNVLVRKNDNARTDLSIPGQTGNTFAASAPTLESFGEYDYFTCQDIAGAIGAHRATYGSKRKIQMNTLLQIAKALAPDIEHIDGRPTISRPNLTMAWMNIGMEVSQTMSSSIAINFMRVQYNSANCQNAIYIQPPQRPQVYVTNGGGNNSGAHVSCTGTSIQMWEISYDGGMTWLPFPVEVPGGCTIYQQ